MDLLEVFLITGFVGFMIVLSTGLQVYMLWLILKSTDEKHQTDSRRVADNREKASPVRKQSGTGRAKTAPSVTPVESHVPSSEEQV